MDANDTKRATCTCELCQPNWQLGAAGDFEPELVAEARMLESHQRKVAQAARELVLQPTG